MKLKKNAFLFAISLLGVNFVFPQYATASPALQNSSVEKANAAAIEKTIASLPQFAARKMEAAHLRKAMANESNDVIVEYLHATPHALIAKEDLSAGLQARKLDLSGTKQKVKANFTGDEFAELSNFDALPLALVRVKNRAALAKLLRHGDVKAVYENKMHQHHMGQSLPLIQQPKAVSVGKFGGSTTVVVLDTGVNYTLPEFGSCTAPGVPSTCRVSDAFDIATNDYLLDNDGHGSNVAGIVAGVALNTSIAALDVFKYDAGKGKNLASSADIIAGINWAINNRFYKNVVAINLSLGTDTKNVGECSSSYATSAFAHARSVGILPVVAAGNNGYADGISEPACAPGAVRVGAVYDSNQGAQSFRTSDTSSCTDSSSSADQITCFSNGGNLLTLLAPGAYINAGGYNYAGTSQAAPHVAGAIAVLRTYINTETADQTVARMTNTGKMVLDYRNGIQKPRLDLGAAINGLVPTEYHNVAEQWCIAYFARPCNPGELETYAFSMKTLTAQTTMDAVYAAMAGSRGLQAMVSYMASTAESSALYGGDTTTMVTKIYNVLFGRAPDAAGLAYWVNAINNGTVVKARAPLAILASAVGSAGSNDNIVVGKKTAVSLYFTKLMDSARKVYAYGVPSSAAQGRQMLGNVNLSTDVTAFQSTANATMAAIVAANP